MPAYNELLEKFAGFDAQVLGISLDTTYSDIAWQRYQVGWLKYPLCSDFYPHGEVARKYGIFRDGPPIPGISDRAIFIADKDGQIAFSRVYMLSEVPENEDVFEALRAMQVTR
jgi:alkyl hydroperoxide reductase subunit AhpC